MFLNEIKKYNELPSVIKQCNTIEKFEKKIYYYVRKKKYCY